MAAITLPDYSTCTDFELVEIESHAVVALRDHSEIDCTYGGEYECAACEEDRAALAAIKAETERRAVLSVAIPDERVGTQALEPYGYERELEQLDRLYG